MLYEYLNMSWPQIQEAKEKNMLFVLSVGAIEQHGHHLPVSVDHVIPYEMVRQRIADKIDVVMLPPIYYGYRSQTTVGGGPHFFGTLRMSAESIIYPVRDIVLELLRFGIDKLMITNGHLENRYFIVDGVERAIQEYNGPNKIKVMYNEWNNYLKQETLDEIFEGKFPGFDYEHAAINETSLMLALAPELVQMDKLPDEYAQRYVNYYVWPSGDELVTKNGALSSAKKSSAQIGERMLEDIVPGILQDIQIEFYNQEKA